MSTLQEAMKWGSAMISHDGRLMPTEAEYMKALIDAAKQADAWKQMYDNSQARIEELQDKAGKAMEDADTVAQRTVERCAKIVDGAWEESISDVTEKIAQDIRSLAAPERVCEWKKIEFINYGPSGWWCQRSCDGMFSLTPYHFKIFNDDLAEWEDEHPHEEPPMGEDYNCPGCGNRIEIKG